MAWPRPCSAPQMIFSRSDATRGTKQGKRVFLFMFLRASECAQKHSLFQSRPGDALFPLLPPQSSRHAETGSPFPRVRWGKEGVRGRMRANRQRPTIYFHPSGCRPRHGPGLITSCKWPFPRKTRRAGSEERVFLFMFWCASEGAPKHSLFQSRTGDAGCLLSTCCCLLPLNFHPSECRPPHSLLS